MKRKEKPLSALGLGERATVGRIEKDDEIKWRLMDLGFVEGARIQVLYQNKSGDPTAYQLSGIVIALRKDQASQIYVESDEYEN